ncbi:MAG: tetratricopeptide repeat protein [Lachnospiraceae bacterium]|nr:tetratricopeptide repeat protein [Lachnospiraceae bacterium]
MAFSAKIINTVKKDASELFTDRTEPQKAFWEKYNGLNTAQGLIDVIHYYGVGGIGKTSLLKKLMDDLLDQGNLYAVLYSFENSQNKEAFLFALSRQISIRCKNADFTVFYHAYMKLRTAEGVSEEELESSLKKNSESVYNSNRMLEALHFMVTVGSDLLPVGGNTVGALGEKMVDALYAKIQKKREDSSNRDSDYIKRIDALNPEDVRKEIHEYFIYDCQKFFSGLDKPFVIMLDGYEYMNDSMRFGDLAFANDLWLCGVGDSHGVVQCLPNVLWVIAGREKVLWSKDILPPDSCHLLGTLSEADTSRYFEMAVSPSGQHMDPALIHGLYELTKGTPVFMDLCFEAYEKGISVHLSDFGRDTRDIAARYLSKMSAEQQQATRFLCCITGIWNREIAEGISAVVSSDVAYDLCIRMHLGTILQNSFIEHIGNRYRISDSLRTIIIDNTRPEEVEKIRIATFTYLAGVLKSNKPGSDPWLEALTLIANYTDDYLSIPEEYLEVIMSSFDALQGLGRYEDMITLFSRMYLGTCKVYGETHEFALMLHHNLGAAFCLTEERENIQKAIEIERDVTRVYTLLKGEKAEDTIRSKMRVALYMRELSDYKASAEALEELLQEALDHLGEGNEVTIRITQTLGTLYADLGEYAKSMKASHLSYECMKELYGEKDTRTLFAQANLGLSYLDEGDLNAAWEYVSKAYNGYKEVCGPENVDTLWILGRLVMIAYNLGDYEMAKKCGETAYDGLQSILGEDHPKALDVLADLNLVYFALGDHEKAIRIATYLYNIRKEKIGENHPKTLDMLQDLFSFYSMSGDLEKARALGEEVVNDRTRVQGPDHPMTLTAAHNLALIYFGLGERDQAIRLEETVLSLRTKVLGSDHPETLKAAQMLQAFHDSP